MRSRTNKKQHKTSCRQTPTQNQQAAALSSPMNQPVLQAAVIAGHFEIAHFLLQNGANADQADFDGDTPRTCALDDGSDELRQLFTELHTIE